MRFFAFACDFDETIARHGQVSNTTVAALKRLAASGRKLILVTGRQLDDLQQVFPEFAIFERLVVENGALLFRPKSGEAKLLATAPPRRFIEALKRHSVHPLSVGSVIIASQQPQDVTILRVIQELGPELQIIYNKSSLMVLPTGVNKATGLLAALSELGLSPHNAVAVGDAENDHALLKICECGVAVANAIPTLKKQADFTTKGEDGDGVAELVEHILRNDLDDVPGRIARNPIVIGSTRSGEEIAIRSMAINILLAGPSGSGKTTVLYALLERILADGYQVCLIDPEGDYDELADVVALGTPARPPDIAEVCKVLQNPKTSAGVNLLGIPAADRPQFFATLLPKLLELRLRTGRPHWLVVDEAHHLLPNSWAPGSEVLPTQMTGLILSTVKPESIMHPALKLIRGLIAVGDSPEHTIRAFSEALQIPAPDGGRVMPRDGEVIAWLLGNRRAPVPVRIQPSESKPARHKRKYAEGRLPADRSFYFKGPAGDLNLRAYNLMNFLELAEGVDEATWLHHLRQGDYSRWIRDSIKDEDLSSEIGTIERKRAINARESREQIADVINRRYTAAEK